MDQRPSKASILGALSQALDLVEGQPEGHALRTAQIGLRLARLLGLSIEQQEDLYFASVLKDSGCSNNAVRIQKIFGGDEHLAKRAVKLIDWSSASESVKFAWRHTESGKSLGAKLRRMASNLGPPAKVMDEVTEARCTRGAAIAKMLSFRPAVSDAIFHLDEHWNGKGSPNRIAKDQIPLLSRVLGFAQTFEIFLSTFGPEAAIDMAKSRSGKWFDPAICRAAAHFECDQLFFAGFGTENFLERDMPNLAVSAVDADVDAICEAFAMIVDAKSSFTAEHSTRVTGYAVMIGRYFNFDRERLANLRCGALLHDIGKLGVPTGILEKPARLDFDEYERIKLHPKFGGEILGRIPTFEPMAEIASAHHERLDGRGYWQGLDEHQLSLDVRIVTVSDVFDALTATRPYRGAMPLEDVWNLMEKDIGTAFDESCLRALQSCLSANELPLAA